MSHNHLFVPGRVTFNESFASFVGSAGAIDFFCRRQGGGPDTVKCHRAVDRWEDEMRFSVFLDGLVAELRTLYGRDDLGYDEKLAAREEIFTAARARFVERVQPAFEASSFSSFLESPLNNATLLSRMLYYHRLPDFQALLDRHGGDLSSAVAYLTAGVEETDDPFTLLPEGGTPAAGPPGDLP